VRFSPAHGKETAFVVRFFLAHGKGRPTPFHSDAVSCFFCRASGKNARQRLFTVRCQKRRTVKRLYRAKSYRVPFVVRLDKKRTAKALPCVFWSLPCASANPEFPVLHLGVLHFFFCRDETLLLPSLKMKKD
jgi:hypothetical protein